MGTATTTHCGHSLPAYVATLRSTHAPDQASAPPPVALDPSTPLAHLSSSTPLSAQPQRPGMGYEQHLKLKRILSSEEYFGIHLGTPFPANLGDGNGWVDQTIELRQDYGSSGIGTCLCLENLIGGNRFTSRAVTVAEGLTGWHSVFRQNGTLADSGALFQA